MFVIPAIAVLFTFVYMRPHEIFSVLAPLNVNLVTALVAFTLVLDVRGGAVRVKRSPLLVVSVLLFSWSLLTTAIKAPDTLGVQMVRLLISMIAFVGVSQGVQSLRALSVASSMLLVFTLILSGLGVYQGMRPTVCHVLQAEGTGTDLMDVADGRPCVRRGDCVEGGLPDKEYGCEHPGLFNTHSIGGRVRFRGLLEDPNELAWVIAMGTPLILALYERRKSMWRLFWVIATLALGFTCVIMTQSRSGQMSMIAMLGVYFVRKFGRRGAIAGVIVALPLLLLGGRSGEEADSSSEERLECWSEALSMWRENPFLGVGGGQFLEHHNLTAHSAFLLSLAELGPLGLLLWTAALYISLKTIISIQMSMAGREDAVAVRTWATALLASLCGLLVSAFFLSITFHTILWIFIGLTGALYAAVRAHDPEFELRFGWRDWAAIATTDLLFVAFVAIYLRLKGV